MEERRNDLWKEGRWKKALNRERVKSWSEKIIIKINKNHTVWGFPFHMSANAEEGKSKAF